MNGSVMLEIFKLRQQLRNWQRTLNRLEDRIVTACDEISELDENDYPEVVKLRNKVNNWNAMCSQIEDQIEDTCERIMDKGCTYKMRNSQ